jgi:multidrug transporter EmrE-like cation transporter
MNRLLVTAIVICVTISALAQIALKAGMMRPSVQAAITSAAPLNIILAVLQSPMVIVGLGLYFGSAALWLMILSKVEVSLAYPFLAVGFVIIAILGKILFDDAMSAQRIAGTALIVGGVLLLARG